MNNNTAKALYGRETESRVVPCDICSFGCPVTAFVKDGVIQDVEPCVDSPLSRGFLCAKGYASRQYVYNDLRIMTPMKRVGPRGSGEFRPISWDEAYGEIAAKLNGYKAQYGPDSVAFFSGYTKWYRPYLHRLAHSFGTLNYGTESSSCFQATVVANKCSSGCMETPDIQNSGVIIGWAFNPYYSNLPVPDVKKQKERGAKIIIVDPKETPAARLADVHLRPIPGTDGALALGIARELISRDIVDHEFIEEYVEGYAPFKEYVQEFTIDKTASITGVAPELIVKAVDIIENFGPMSIIEGNAGMIHHTNGVQNYRAVNALLALTGAYGKKGGCKPYKAADPTGNKLLQEEEFINQYRPQNAKPKIGSEKYSLWSCCIDEYQAMELAQQIFTEKPYPIKAIFALGMNARMFPHNEDMFKALETVDFFVDADIIMSDTAKYADIILPACTSFERDELRSQGNKLVYYKKAIQPLGESRSDADIVCGLAKALNLDDELLTAGFDTCCRYLMEKLPVTLEEVREKGIVEVPSISSADKLTFYTKSGKYELWSSLAQEKGLEPLPKYYDPYDAADPEEYPLILCSGGRLPWAFASRFHHVVWARELRKEASLDMSPALAKKLSIEQGSDVVLSTTAGSLTLKANITDLCLENMVCLYHGYSEADVNSLIPQGHNDHYSGFPGYRSVRCRVERRESQGEKTSHESVALASGQLKFQQEKCTGCGACVVACMARNSTDLTVERPYRQLYEVTGKENLTFDLEFCAHCHEPKCLQACPVKAISKDHLGNVLIDEKLCIGCLACKRACEQDIIYRGTDGKAHKCDGCKDRVSLGLMPKCVEACRFGALEHKLSSAAAVILAGGKSSRMGRDKSQLQLSDSTFVQGLVKSFGKRFERVYVSTAPGRTVEAACTGVVYDEREGLGPLSGLLAALEAVEGDAVFICATDIPYADPALAVTLLAKMGDKDACVIKRRDGRLETAFAAFSKGCKDAVRHVLEAGDRSFRQLLREIDVEYVDEDDLPGWDLDKLLVNVNTPEDYNKFIHDQA